MITKKTFKRLVIFIGVIAFILWIIWGNTYIQVSHFTIENEKIPQEFDGYKIAQISDLHNKDWGDRLVNALEEETPDIIVITGDLIDSSHTDLEVAMELISQIKNMAPIYFVTGNHEAWSNQFTILKQDLLDEGVTILDNNKIILQQGEEEILLVGLQDPSFNIEGGMISEQTTSIESKLSELTNGFEGYKILLAHRPELFEAYVSENIELILSGHAHGGQIRIPFIGGLIAPNQGLLPEYTSGVYQENESNMIISRGLGNSMIPVRINNSPELVIVELDN